MHKFKTKYQGIQLLSVRESAEPGISLSSPKAVCEYMKAEASADREIFWILHLNHQNRIIHKEMAAMGTVDRCSGMDIKMIFRCAVISGSVSIMTVHNHPSGSAKPSKEDKKLWMMIGLAGDLLGINVMDNLIISPNGFYSQKEGEYGLNKATQNLKPRKKAV